MNFQKVVILLNKMTDFSKIRAYHVQKISVFSWLYPELKPNI